MESKQFYTTCKYCGRQILMVMNTQNRRYIPCDSVISLYIPDPNGKEIYIDEFGQTRSGYGSTDGKGEVGYQKHYDSVKKRHHS